MPESDAPMVMDEVMRSVGEPPLVARSLVEGAGHRIERMFLDDPVEKFIRCRMAWFGARELRFAGDRR